LLADDQWYFIVLTEEQKEEMLGGYVSPGGAEAWGPLGQDSYNQIRAIYQVTDEGTLFSKVSSRHSRGPEKLVAFGEKPVLKEQGNSVLLTGDVDAYWNGRSLFFKKFSLARPLFPGIQKVYKELTESATNEFLSSDLFELKDEMSSHFIGLRNRKIIASIVEGKSIDLADPETREKYVEYAKEYNLDLEIDGGKISLIDNADVQKVIDLFGEKFYTSYVTQEKREVRMSKKLVHGARKRAR